MQPKSCLRKNEILKDCQFLRRKRKSLNNFVGTFRHKNVIFFKSAKNTNFYTQRNLF
jgi:hypothetical protein